MSDVLDAFCSSNAGDIETFGVASPVSKHEPSKCDCPGHNHLAHLSGDSRLNAMKHRISLHLPHLPIADALAQLGQPLSDLQASIGQSIAYRVLSANMSEALRLH